MNGIGVDILAIDRLKPLEGKWDDAFFLSVFTEEERAFCLMQARPLWAFAANFAAKEAVFKSLSLSGAEVLLQEIEIGRSEIGQPTVKLHGNLEKQVAHGGTSHIYLSLSYEETMVLAFAVTE